MALPCAPFGAALQNMRYGDYPQLRTWVPRQIVTIGAITLNLRLTVGLFWDCCRTISRVGLGHLFALGEGMHPWECVENCHRAWCRVGCPDVVLPSSSDAEKDVIPRYCQCLICITRAAPEGEVPTSTGRASC